MQPFALPDDITGPFVAPNGAHVFVSNNEAEAQAKYEQLINEPVILPDGTEHKLSPSEILFFKWLGKMIIIWIIMTKGI